VDGRSPEPRRKEEDGTDGRDPPVSDRVRGRARAAPVWAGRERAGLRAELQAAHHTVAFPFSFYAIFALCLILYNKSCANPKMMKLFV